MGTVLENPSESQKNSLYERDFHAWLAEQARILRAGQTENLDIRNLIEEIEDMGRSEEAALESAMEQALLHLAKLAFSPSSDPRRGWKASVVKQRVEIEKRIRRNPGLQSKMEALHQEAWKDARKLAIAEMAAHNETPTIPNECPFSIKDVRDESFWPKALSLLADASGSKRDSKGFDR